MSLTQFGLLPSMSAGILLRASLSHAVLSDSMLIIALSSWNHRLDFILQRSALRLQETERQKGSCPTGSESIVTATVST